jgi:23S rRNA (adenine2030-N6)-methyltransferase
LIAPAAGQAASLFSLSAERLNYQHAFHAGNFADVLKHIVLCEIITYLQRKPGPIRIIDTHAGEGLYDLSSDATRRTGEWREGEGRLAAPFRPDVEMILQTYRATLHKIRSQFGPASYPGSPLIARSLLRSGDRYMGSELRPDAVERLRQALAGDSRCKALAQNAWHALRANVPPPERRGVVLIDPAFEKPDEWTALAKEMLAAHAKWPSGCYVAWYPLKNPRDADELSGALAAVGTGHLRIELMVDDLTTALKLAGCGLLVINPPWTLRDQCQVLLPALAERLAQADMVGYRCDMVGA